MRSRHEQSRASRRNVYRAAGFPRRVHLRRARAARQTRACAAAKEVVLFIGQNAPAAHCSAAGVRTRALIEGFVDHGFSVAFAAQAKTDEYTQTALERSGACTLYEIQANREECVRNLLQKLQPTVVVFDRFISEEAFSFHVRTVVPSAMMVLDMQDCCFLREGRREACEAADRAEVAGGDPILEASRFRPLATDVRVSRELGSIHRCDLALVCSRVEMDLLEEMGVSTRKMVYAPFFVDALARRGQISPAFESRRRGFVTIGTMKHAPNRDGLDWLFHHVWPLVRKDLDGATVTVYGAHFSDHHTKQYHRPDLGFEVGGWLEEERLLQTLEQHRVMLAPLRYGAGLKGKIVDGWIAGCPCVTTSVGAEGMSSEGADAFGGIVDGVVDSASFAEACVRLHEEKSIWEKKRVLGFRALSVGFDRDHHHRAIRERICDALVNLDERRSSDFTQSMLWHHNNRSTEFFSRWIELKEKMRSEQK